jgi:hypothetical protein
MTIIMIRITSTLPRATGKAITKIFGFSFFDSHFFEVMLNASSFPQFSKDIGISSLIARPMSFNRPVDAFELLNSRVAFEVGEPKS